MCWPTPFKSSILFITEKRFFFQYVQDETLQQFTEQRSAGEVPELGHGRRRGVLRSTPSVLAAQQTTFFLPVCTVCEVSLFFQTDGSVVGSVLLLSPYGRFLVPRVVLFLIFL